MTYEQSFREYLEVEEIDYELVEDLYPVFEFAMQELISSGLTEEEALQMIKLADKMKWE